MPAMPLAACSGWRPFIMVAAMQLALSTVAAPANEDEAAVPAFTLPDVLAGPDGRPVTTAEAWRSAARPHQFAALEKTVYGRRLPPVAVTAVGEVERAEVDLEGGVTAVRLQARLRLGEGEAAPTTEVLFYRPRSPQPVPVFLNLNFKGNQAEIADPAVHLCRAWLPDDPQAGIVGHRATDASRGVQARGWPVADLVRRGYGMATACYGDTFPDRPDGRPASALAALGRPVTDLPSDEPGAIGTWAWQLSRILDWLVTRPDVDAARVIVVGHSRNGKAALWAGACDERFAMVVSNESGCGGAALERRHVGETIAQITARFPHWFCPAFAGFAGRASEMPVDAHVTLAMTAPRPLYVASAIEDLWADPRGEFLAAAAASPVWQLFGRTGVGAAGFPSPPATVGGWVGYHVRPGGHDLRAEDWKCFADFADRTVRGREDSPTAAGTGGHGFRPVQEPLPVKPPAGAILLFGDGSEGPPKFVSTKGEPIDWAVEDGSLFMRRHLGHRNHIVSTDVFEDADIHAEFMTTKQAQGNSGLYIHGLFEMQIADSFGVDPPTDQDAGSLYRFAKPLAAAARPVGQWQVYDIRYTAPRRDAAGKVLQPGSITAWLNRRLVQDGIEFSEPRSPYIPYRHGVTDYLRGVKRRLDETGTGPLFLQDHGSPVRFRNIWIVPR